MKKLFGFVHIVIKAENNWSDQIEFNKLNRFTLDMIVYGSIFFFFQMKWNWFECECIWCYLPMYTNVFKVSINCLHIWQHPQHKQNKQSRQTALNKYKHININKSKATEIYSILFKGYEIVWNVGVKIHTDFKYKDIFFCRIICLRVMYEYFIAINRKLHLNRTIGRAQFVELWLRVAL